MMKRSSNGKHPSGLSTLRKAAVIAFSAVVAMSLCSCRPTDFFTEIIISPFADIVDEDNPDRTVINSPDATEESSDLSALDWTDESERTEEENTLVVYSSDPTTDLTTRHSIFDLQPLLDGVEASDGVRLVFDPTAELDEETEGWMEQPEDAESTGTGAVGDESDEEDQDDAVDSDTADDSETTEDADADSDESSDSDSDESDASGGGSSEDGENDAAGGDAESGEEEGDGSGGDSGGEEAGEGENDSGNSGSGENPYGGYGGEVDEYNSGDAFAEVPKAESIAVIGTDVAVMAQAIGGAGAIAAMSEDAFYGVEEDGVVSSFQEVFTQSGEIDEDFEEECLVWENDGTDPDDLSDVEELIDACGEDGVIFYDQDLGDQTDFFNKKQRQALQAHGFEMVPVEFASIQGILDAAGAIGDSLSDSDTCENDSDAYAKSYKTNVKAIVSACAAAHGGGYASKSTSSSYKLLSDYNDNPESSAVIGGNHGFPVATYIATDAATGWSYSSSAIDASDVVLFCYEDYDRSPLAAWSQFAGVAPGYGERSKFDDDVIENTIELIDPLIDSDVTGSGSLYNQWLASDSANTKMNTGPSSLDEGMNYKTMHGLGSELIPYLVVSGTSDYTAEEVRDLTVDSISSYSDDGEATFYSAFPYGIDEGKLQPLYYSDEETIASTIGSMDSLSTSENPFLTGLEAEDVVRENPSGLLGDWTEGNIESVLETVWLTDLYSRSPYGCSYEPVNDMDDYSCKLTDPESGESDEFTTLRKTVKEFYSIYYRVDPSDFSGYYNAVVTDQFEGL